MDQLLLQNLDDHWMEFVSLRSDSLIFHHPAWIQLLSSTYGFVPKLISLVSSDGTIKAGLPIYKVFNLIEGKRWVSMPFTDFCPPLGSETDIQSMFLNFCTLINHEPVEIRWSVSLDKNIQQSPKYVVHKLKLSNDFDSTYKNFHQMHRRNINAAKKNGVTTVFGSSENEIRQYYRLHLLTRKQQGLPTQPWKFFSILNKNILQKGMGFVILAYHDDDCLAGAVFLHWQGTLTYKYGASKKDNLSLKPNNLVMNDAIHWACSNGISIFDMGRTDLDNSGLRDFKSRWGAEEIPLTYTYINSKNNTLGSVALNPVNKIIQKSPTWVTKFLGELLYRYFA